MAKAIVAIGGGQIRTRGTADIDREIIRLSNKEHPRILFVPTASSDSARYWQRFLEYFGKFLKCKADVLFLVNEPPSARQIERKILSADIVYVGGGNTLFMMRVWRRLGVDKLLKTAYENGTVLSGISAGAICWFETGITDSWAERLAPLPCLGWLPHACCPHYDGEKDRRPSVHKFVAKGTAPETLALDDGAAAHFVGRKLVRIVASRENAGGYCVRRSGRRTWNVRVPSTQRCSRSVLRIRRDRSLRRARRCSGGDTQSR